MAGILLKLAALLAGLTTFDGSPVSAQPGLAPGGRVSIVVPALSCPSQPCLNGGRCWYRRCICRHGWTGPFCKTRVGCPVSRCSNGGRCVSNRCRCARGWRGTYCTVRVTTCSYLNCRNGGRCVGNRCRCRSGWTGTYCTVRNQCPRAPCRNGGNCVRNRCRCRSGWMGTYCTVRKTTCSSRNCRNGGRCVGNRCRCQSGWTGTYCTVRNRCPRAPCRNGGRCVGNRCRCRSGWTGTYCTVRSQCPRAPCHNGGRCVRNRCRCRSGWTGTYCTVRNRCPRAPCRNSGSCVRNRCRCRSGWTGTYCTVRVPTCSYVNCRNGGRCVANRCVCAYGWTGPTCTKRSRCSRANCHNGGQCLYNRCVCKPGWVGPHCDAKAGTCPPVSRPPQPPPVCKRALCRKDMDCPGRKKCCPGGHPLSCRQCLCPPVLCDLFCPNGFKVDNHGCQLCECNSGPQCQPTCKNGGTCTATNTCQCPSGYTGQQCETEIVQEPPECTVEGSVGLNRCGQRCTCRNEQFVDCCRIRKEIHSMSQQERQLFIDTYKQASSRADFRALIRSHEQNFGNGIHTKDQFLPWHRYFMLALENILQDIDCRVTLPYWAWCLHANSPWLAPLWGPQSHWYGGDGVGSSNCVSTGPFRQGVWSTVSGQCLARDFTGTLPNCIIVNDVLSSSVAQFDDFEFRLRAELHDFVHCQISGTMCSFQSAEAPEFFLHHGYIDKLWNDWQSNSPAHKQAYFSGLTSPMTAANGNSAQQLIDLANHPGGVCVVYEEPSSRTAIRLRNLFRRTRGRAHEVAGRVPCSATAKVSSKAVSLFRLSPSDVARLERFTRKNVCKVSAAPRGPLGFDPSQLEADLERAPERRAGSAGFV